MVAKMTESSTQQIPPKRKPSLNLASVVKKVVLEEASDTTDIINSLRQHRYLIESLQAAQNAALAQAIMMTSQMDSCTNPQQQPVVLEIVPSDEQAWASGLPLKDRRRIKIKRPATTAPVVNSNITDRPLLKSTPCKTVDQVENDNLICQPGAGSTESLQVASIQNLEDTELHHGENVYFSIPMSAADLPNSDEGHNHLSEEIRDQVAMIEIQDEDQNQIILPPELQQPILQLLSTRGANLRKITFTHNDVIQTIEIVPPDASSTSDEGTHLILTPGGQDVIESHSEQS